MKVSAAMKIALDKISRGESPDVQSRPGRRSSQAATACIKAGLAVYDNSKGYRLTLLGVEQLTT